MAINLERFISNACCNSCQSFYDHYVEANVRFRSRLGMKAVIIRRQLGHCCDWCASLAGIYDPYNAPDDIYRRHSNCRCMVTYKTQDGYQNVWNKKIYETQREARIEKIHSDEHNKDVIDIFEKEKRKLISENKHIYDATKEWKALAQPNNVKIRYLHRVTIDGTRYTVDGKYVLLDLKDYEKKTLAEFVRTFGGIMEYHPRIVYPERISTPDCLYNGIKYDLKTLGLDNPGVKGKNLMLHAIQDKQDQAHYFIFDISRTGLSRDEAIEQAELLFFRRKTKFIHTAVLYDGKEFFKIIQRI